MINKVISQAKTATCLLDPIPAPLFRLIRDCLEADILNIVNYSLQTGDLPDACKTALVKHL